MALCEGKRVACGEEKRVRGRKGKGRRIEELLLGKKACQEREKGQRGKERRGRKERSSPQRR